jgi:predicted Holliday junction resolvase-like endonuclease
MDFNRFIILFYQEQHFIFGVCPCCYHIFQLSECVVSVKGKKIILPEVKEIMEHQAQVSKQEERLSMLDQKLFDQQDKYTYLEQEIKDGESHIERRYRNEGRKQALKKIKKVDKVFIKRNIDPRDVRLIFNPVEYIAFKGLTDDEEIRSISFLTRHIESRKHELAIDSLDKTINKGNLEFVVIRIDDDGKISYEKKE